MNIRTSHSLGFLPFALPLIVPTWIPHVIPVTFYALVAYLIVWPIACARNDRRNNDFGWLPNFVLRVLGSIVIFMVAVVIRGLWEITHIYGA